jgi:glycosyltransferase involved in cell wall biosynthesis
MRVVVALENRFIKTQNGNIYSTTVCDYSFWKRYLQVFDEVIVFARVKNVPVEVTDKSPANGPGVSFFELPSFIGPLQYIGKHFQLNKLSQKAIDVADAFILRIPGTMGTLLWKELVRRKIPYGIEVVGNSRDSYDTCGTNRIFKTLTKWHFVHNQAQQCLKASAAAYVTEQYLQSLYPSECWSTNYSSIDLPAESIVSDSQVEIKLKSLDAAFEGKRPFKICHIGTMTALYKAQNVLIEAVAICRKKGFKVELIFLGNGIYQNSFVKKARDLNIAEFVKFAGRVSPGQQVRQYLDNSDMFILPSLTEGLPRSLIEAMARGLPCISSNVGGIPELLEPEDMVSPGDVGLLTAKIESVLTDAARMEKMSRRNVKTAMAYRHDKLNKRRIEFHRKVKELGEKQIGFSGPQ